MSRILISPETGLIMIKLDWIGLFATNETQRAAQSLVPFEEIAAGGRP